MDLPGCHVDLPVRHPEFLLQGEAVGDAVIIIRHVGSAADWVQIWNVLSALAVSPILRLIGAGLLYFVIRHLVHDQHPYEPPQADNLVGARPFHPDLHQCQFLAWCQ